MEIIAYMIIAIWAGILLLVAWGFYMMHLYEKYEKDENEAYRKLNRELGKTYRKRYEDAG